MTEGHTINIMNDEGVDHEKDISTEQYPPQAHPRVPGPGANQERTRRSPPPSGQGPQTSGRLTFRHHNRIKNRPEFLACYSRGRKYHSRCFLLFCFADTSAGKQDEPRIGISVGRKIGNAVQRNRIKRLVREFFRLEREAFPSGADIIIVAKRGIDPTKLCLTDIREDLRTPLRRASRDAAEARAQVTA